MIKMKICMVISTPFPPREGVGYYAYNLSKKLIEKGHKVIIITRGSFNKTQRKVFDGIDVISAPFIPIYPFYLKIHGFFINRLFKSLAPEVDILHVHTPLPPFIKTSCPVITTVHTPMLTDHYYVKIDSFYSFFSKISAKFVSYPLELKHIHNSNIVTTVTNQIAQELQEYNYNPKDVVVVGNGVDDKFFYPSKKKSENNNKYILYIGRMDSEKGLFDLVESARYVCNKRSDISFILAGSGKDLNKLKKKTKKLGLEGKFKFLGQVEKSQIVELYQKASIFVLPSYHEGLPTVLLEAMACGLPIIATNVRGNNDLIVNKKNGILVAARQPNQLAEAICSLIDDKKLKESLGKNARKQIEQKYSWDAVSKKYLKCYELITRS